MVAVRKRIGIALARHRLRSHMYARLIHGGTPDCPCSRCTQDKATVLELTGEPWDDPERAAYWRDYERTMKVARMSRDVAESRSLTLDEAKGRVLRSAGIKEQVEADFFCECEDVACTALLALTLDEWEAVRNEYPTAARFYVVLQGHDFGEPIAFSGKAKSGVAFDVVQGYPRSEKRP